MRCQGESNPTPNPGVSLGLGLDTDLGNGEAVPTGSKTVGTCVCEGLGVGMRFRVGAVGSDASEFVGTEVLVTVIAGGVDTPLFPRAVGEGTNRSVTSGSEGVAVGSETVA